MSPRLSIPESLWNTVSPEAQTAILAVIASLEKRIADLEARLNQNSTNSSRPPSSDPPAVKVKRRPPTPPSGVRPGGPIEPNAAGRAADGASGIAPVWVDAGLVPSRRSPVGVVPRPAVVPGQGGA